MEIRQQQQSNNLNTVFIHSPGSKVSSVQIWFRAGSAFEKGKNQGIAHFLEHMFFKGTAKNPGSAIAKQVEEIGGEINAFTSFDYTCYYINSPTQHTMKTVDLLLDMVSNPTFKEDELVPEREVVFEEYRRSLDNPNQNAFNHMIKNSFEGGYSHPILGSEETIKNFTRTQLIDFRQKYYNNSNALLVVSGDLDEVKSLDNKINEYQLPDGPSSDFLPFKLSQKSKVDIFYDNVTMCKFTILIQGSSYLSEDGAYEDLALNCLGYGETSPLYKRLVLETSLANNVSTSTLFLADGGIHFLRFNCPEENFQKVLTEAEKVISQAFKNGFEEKDIQKIRSQYIASKIYEKESLESLAFTLGHGFAQSGDIHSEEEFIKKINEADLNSVHRAFSSIFKRPLHITLQVPKKVKVTKFKAPVQSFKKKIKENQRKWRLKKHALTGIKPSKYDENALTLKLKEGITLVYRRNTNTPTFVAHVYLKGGLAAENDRTNGLYHLLATTLTKGYGKVPYEKIKGELESLSASINGFGGKNAYGLTMHGQTAHMDQLLEHFIGQLLQPSFPNKYVVHEKKMTERALDNENEDPTRNCFREVSKLLFADHPYSRHIYGSKKSLTQIKRKTLESTHTQNLKKSEIVITYCGDLKLEKLLTKLDPYLTQLKPRKSSKMPKPKQKSVTGKKIHLTFEREQCQVFMGIKSFALAQKQNAYMKMLTVYLSGQSSPLFVEVRDRQGLCYAVQPVQFTGIDGGYWGIYIGSGKDKVEQSIKAIYEILHDIRDNALSEEQFNSIKSMVAGQQQLSLQTNEDFANTYSIPQLHGFGIDHYYTTNKTIEECDYQEFKKFCTEFLSKEFNIVTVGPTPPEI